MATASSKSDSKWEDGLLEKGLQCPICIEFLCEPLTLGCSHSFCRLCLLQATRLAPDGRRCPECRAPIEIRDPVTHAVDAALAAKVSAVVPAEVLRSREGADAEKLAAFLVRERQNYPVFYMRGVASKPGQSVNLHFFEPRYKILIRRTWEGSHRFICTQREPRQGDVGLVVHVDAANFLPDGRANIRGSGIELVTLGRVSVEEDTGGLYHAEIADAPKASASTRASSNGPVAALETTSAGGRRQQVASSSHTVESEVRAREALRRAIRKGAPEYNRGNIERCANIYTTVAQQTLQDIPIGRDMFRRLQRGLEEAEDARRQGDVNEAAWALRRAFDDSLQDPMPANARAQARRSATTTTDSSEVLNITVEDEQELPVFFMSPSAGVTVGEAVRLRLFEPRYKVLAREVESATGRLFLYASGTPRTGAVATVIRVDQCSWDAQGNAHVNGVGVDRVRLGVVREDAQKSGLFYACCSKTDNGASRLQGAERAATSSRAANGSAAPKCCTMQ